MKIRDSFAVISGDKTETEMPSGGLEIISDSGHTLFSISLKDGELRIDSGSTCKHGGDILDTGLNISPITSNCVFISRPIYKNGGQ